MTTDAVKPAGDPQIGNLATPINSSGFTQAFINNLPAYRSGLSAQRRGLEIGMAHGYFLFGPFARLGPLRNSEFADFAGAASATFLVLILTICLSLYAGSGAPDPIKTVTTPNPPAALSSSEGWSEFAGGFLVGGIGGVLFAYLLIQVINSGALQAIGIFG